MKRLIKTAIFLLVMGIFTFSTNPTITSVREGTVKYGKMGYEKVVDLLKGSENENVRQFGEQIE